SCPDRSPAETDCDVDRGAVSSTKQYRVALCHEIGCNYIMPNRVASTSRDLDARGEPYPSGVPRATHRILVVEDEPALVDTLEYSLSRQGYDVEVATDGAKALASARREQPDLVILDVMLPILDGF